MVFFGLLLLPVHAGRKAFKGIEGSKREINWIIKDDGIHISNLLEKEVWSWDKIKKVKYYDDAISVTSKTTNVSAFMFKKGFSDSTAFDQAIEFINSKMKGL